jgi:hypothetical protein
MLLSLFLGPISGVIMSQSQTWVEQRRFTLKTLRDFGFGKASKFSNFNSVLRPLFCLCL